MPLTRVQIARNKLGALVHNGASYEVIEEARRELAIARAEAQIAKIVDQAPPLTHEQRLRLAALFVAPRKAAERSIESTASRSIGEQIDRIDGEQAAS